jgi:hypothetical protein
MVAGGGTAGHHEHPGERDPECLAAPAACGARLELSLCSTAQVLAQLL